MNLELLRLQMLNLYMYIVYIFPWFLCIIYGFFKKIFFINFIEFFKLRIWAVIHLYADRIHLSCFNVLFETSEKSLANEADVAEVYGNSKYDVTLHLWENYLRILSKYSIHLGY